MVILTKPIIPIIASMGLKLLIQPKLVKAVKLLVTISSLNIDFVTRAVVFIDTTFEVPTADLVTTSGESFAIISSRQLLCPHFL